MLVSSLYDDAEPTAVEAGASDVQAAPEWPTADAAPSESSSGGSWPFAVVGVALVLGVAAAKWIAWSSTWRQALTAARASAAPRRTSPTWTRTLCPARDRARSQRDQAGSLATIGIGLGLFVGAALFAFFAIAFTLATITAGLATAVPTWLALLIVTIALFLLVVLLVLVGRAAIQRATPPLPEQAIEESAADHGGGEEWRALMRTFAASSARNASKLVGAIGMLRTEIKAATDIRGRLRTHLPAATAGALGLGFGRRRGHRRHRAPAHRPRLSYAVTVKLCRSFACSADPYE